MDVVFDGVGGDTLERSWGVLTPGGRMITIAADSEGTDDQRVKDAFFIVEPNQKQLVEIAGQLDAGNLRAFVKTMVSLNEASAAYCGAVTNKNGYGKIVIGFPPTLDSIKRLSVHGPVQCSVQIGAALISAR